MHYLTGDALYFFGHLTSAGSGKTGLGDVHIAIVRTNTDGTRTVVKSAASATAATEVDAVNAPGWYQYLLAGASVDTAGAYEGTFITADTTVDLKHVPALGGLVSVATWATRIDTNVGSRGTSTYAGGAVASVTAAVTVTPTPPTAAQIAAAILATPANLLATNSSGQVTAASVVADVGITQAGADKVWGSAARTLTGFGTLAADVWAAASRTLSAFAFKPTVGGYDTGQDPASLLLVTPANLLATNADGAVPASSLTGYVAPDNAGIAAVQAVTDALPTFPSDPASNTQVNTRSSHSAADVWAVTARTLSAAGVTAIWAAALSGLTAAGSIGKLIADRLAGLVPTSVTVSSPVAAGGTITLIGGDDYAAADSRTIRVTLTTADDLTGGAVVLTLTDVAGVSWAGSLAAGSEPNTWDLAWDLTHAQTGGLSRLPYRYRIVVTRGGRTLTEVLGELQVI
jgi:hypothetical protein